MQTIHHRLREWAKNRPNDPAQKFKNHKDEWETISAGEFSDRVHAISAFLSKRGVGSDDSICIFSPNCPEWVHLDLGALLGNVRSAGIYPNSNDNDIAYILNHTEAKVFAVKDRSFFERTAIPDSVELVIVFEGDADFSEKAWTYAEVIEEGRQLILDRESKSFETLLNELDAEAGKIMIYTSGTTGNPKGALLSAKNLMFMSDAVASVWNLEETRDQGGSMFSFLPLCHIAEKLQNIGVGLSLHYCVCFASKFENVSKELVEVQPTVLLSVPRLWEKMMEGVELKLNQAKGFKKKLARWALSVGARVTLKKLNRQFVTPIDYAQLAVANRLVIQKVRRAMGLEKTNAAASGAAALPAHVSRWFYSLGIQINEAFGQTESTGIICMTRRGEDGAGTVGYPVPGTEMRLADDGEVLTRGPHVFCGYFQNEEATRDTVKDGWLLTGDLATQLPSGAIRIRGRKKEILKTSGGKMIAPLPIEERIKESSIVSQVCMVGEGRKYFSALITLSETVLEELQKKGSGSRSQAGVITNDDSPVHQEVGTLVEKVNADLASFEQIKRFSVLDREFSIEEGEMTPTLKMKRQVIETHFQDVINRMYQ